MQQEFESHQFTDGDGNPAGGHTFGPGFSIAWQNGPLATGVRPEECILGHDPDWAQYPSEAHAGEPCRRAPNGAFVETIIAAARDRLEFYQAGKFNCGENALAIEYLEKALATLQSRTAKRTAQGIEGTHETHETSWDEAHFASEAKRRERIEVSLSWVGDGPCWVTRPSGSVEGPLNKQSAIDILLAEPTSGVHLFDPRG